MLRRLIFITALVFLAATLAPNASDARKRNPSTDLLDSPGKRSAPISTVPQWQRVLKNHAVEMQTQNFKQYAAWQKFLSSIKGETKIRQMMRVNMWFKKFPYKQDAWVYNQADYWTSPAEFLNTGGDCEDYAIIKYMSLRQLGWSKDDLKVAMVYDVYSGTDHAFLIVKHEGVEYVLDNREKVTVSRYMKNRYQIHYAFNEKSVWTYNSPKVVRKMRDGSVLPGNR